MTLMLKIYTFVYGIGFGVYINLHNIINDMTEEDKDKIESSRIMIVGKGDNRLRAAKYMSSKRACSSSGTYFR